MKKDKTSIILTIIFLIGLSVMLYPSFSNYWNSKRQTEAVATYDATVSKMSDNDYERLFDEAEEYNKSLLGIESPLENDSSLLNFDDVLDISGGGILGYVTIDKLDIELPIYHGTSAGVLQVGVGLLKGSSFPIGGEGTHAVLSAHRGLPSAELFSHLDEMEEGDTFQITVLNRVLTYEVDQIHIVLPENTEDLKIDPDKDYCTLMTCTPYGINTHRLLVRGVRIDGLSESVPADGYQVEPKMVAFIITIVLLILMLLVTWIRWLVNRMPVMRQQKPSENS